MRIAHLFGLTVALLACGCTYEVLRLPMGPCGGALCADLAGEVDAADGGDAAAADGHVDGAADDYGTGDSGQGTDGHGLGDGGNSQDGHGGGDGDGGYSQDGHGYSDGGYGQDGSGYSDGGYGQDGYGYSDGGYGRDGYGGGDVRPPTDLIWVLDLDFGDPIVWADEGTCNADCSVEGTTYCGPSCNNCCTGNVCNLLNECR